MNQNEKLVALPQTPSWIMAKRSKETGKEKS